MTDANGRNLVLLVEDDALSLKLMKDFLEAHGYAVAQAANGPDALSLLQMLAPNLVVMDIGLPGMDGIEVTRRLKANAATAAIPLFAVSAYAMPGDEARMREAGCDAFMTKPLRFTDFVAEVGRLLDKRDSLTLRER
jgi:two-component system, cell cycle response regulator DivK